MHQLIPRPEGQASLLQRGRAPICVLVSLALFMLVVLGTPPRQVTIAASVPQESTVTAAACDDTWTLLSRRRFGNGDTGLNDIVALGPNDAWAVGHHSLNGAKHQPLLQHWDGSNWLFVPAPAVDVGGDLLAIDAASSNDVWAVGTDGDPFNPFPSQTLIVHWNGTNWSRIASPNGAPAQSNTLYAIDVLSASNIWAVGNDGSAPIILNWNGAEWKKIANPTLANDIPLLYSVAAIAPDDVWAVGYYSNGSGRPLTIHWNGSQWSEVPSLADGLLYAVAGTASNDVWAVGTIPSQPLALHWDGVSWSAVSFGDLASTDASLSAVAALAPDNVWAVGYGTTAAYAFHWDGVAWRDTQVGGARPRGMAALSSTDIWMTGQIGTGAGIGQTFIRRYAPTVGIAGASIARTGGSGSANVAVALSATVPQTVTVHYATDDNTAVAGQDYTPTSGDVSIPPCTRDAAFNLALLHNPVWKPAAVVDLRLSDPHGAALGSTALRGLNIADVSNAPPGRVVYLPLTRRATPIERIAYVGGTPGAQEDVWVMNADGSGQQRLTASPAVDQDPAWSPDGRRIAFSTNRDGNFEIYVMNAHGSQLTRLTNRPTDDSQPTWSADGQQIAFVSQRSLGGGITQDLIYVMGADGSGQRSLSNPPQRIDAADTAPAWSPNGSQIAFTGVRAGHSAVYLMQSDGSQAHAITPLDYARSAPVWLPDGGRLSFYTGPDLNLNITTVRLDGSDARLVNPNFDSGASFAWSPDGTRLALADFSGGIAIMDPTGGEPLQLAQHTARDLAPVWAPR